MPTSWVARSGHDPDKVDDVSRVELVGFVESLQSAVQVDNRFYLAQSNQR